MSLSVWGDEGDVPVNGRDTAIYQELAPIYDKFAKWLVKYQKDFSGPEDEELAGKIDQMLCKLCDDLAAWEP